MDLRSARPALKIAVLLLALSITTWLLPQPRAQAQGPDAKAGTVKMIKVHGASLEGNLEGDSADRDVLVYLPPSYASQPNRRFPVVYFLHGYAITAEAFWKAITVPDTANKTMSAGTVQEMILVKPDAHTRYQGSFYSNSPTTGNWEAYITHDLVAYIDSHYRTIANSRGRGLVGHSMGGYGTLRIAMKYPGVYSSIYAMSSCCLMNDPAEFLPIQAAMATKGGFVPKGAPAGEKGSKGPPGGFANNPKAKAAAWSPNPKNPPTFFDEPLENGAVRPEFAAKWIANSPLAFVDQYVPSLKTYQAIMIDVGLEDRLATSNREMDAALTRLGVAHTFEAYEGNHVNRVKERFATKVLPFFSENLKSSSPRSR